MTFYAVSSLFGKVAKFYYISVKSNKAFDGKEKEVQAMMTIERRLKMISILDKMERHPIATKQMNVIDVSVFKEKDIKELENNNYKEGKIYE